MRNHTSLYHAPAALLWMEKNWNYKINRATLNIFILNNRLTTTKTHFRFCGTLNAFYLFSLSLFFLNVTDLWSRRCLTRTHTTFHRYQLDISAINQTKMQSTKHKSYTAQFTRSTVRSACSAETNIYCACEGWYFTCIFEHTWSTTPCLHHR